MKRKPKRNQGLIQDHPDALTDSVKTIPFVPPDEGERLKALRRYDILDTPPDGTFDNVTALAADIFKVPISIVSLVDHDRIWFKSSYGLDIRQVDRDPGLCASAILSPEVYHIKDARSDPRALTNPLVAGEFGLRFYAAAPLVTCDGYNLGTLCIMDKQPRQLTEIQMAELRRLAAVVMDQMELRISARKLATTESALRRITIGLSSVTGEAFLYSLVQQLVNTFKVDYALIGAFNQDEKVRTLAVYSQDGFVENFEFTLPSSSRENILGSKASLVLGNVRWQFPEEHELSTVEVQSFIGVQLTYSSGQPMGLLAIMNKTPVEGVEILESLLPIFAVRAATELERNRLQAENTYLQEEIKAEYNFAEIIGQTNVLTKVFQKVERVAPTETTVLIQGETGTGKELIARAIHNLSSRKDRPLIKVNCGAISAGLVESELFGHERGAFTGAIQQRIGRFELADGGTIFLDEVVELPMDTQVKLLRVIQEGEFERVGSSKPIGVNVRIIAATNRDLSETVREGSFRSDLFYRLNVFPIEVPPLRSRISDIPLLVKFFLQIFAKKLNKQIQGATTETMDRLMSYMWPGNIRELQNVIERAVILAPGSVIDIDDSFLQHNIASQTLAQEKLNDVERAHILRILDQTHWIIDGRRGAASILGINPSTLRFRMKKLDIKKPRIDNQT